MMLLAGGYVHELQRAGKVITIDEFLGKYKGWSLLLRKMAYNNVADIVYEIKDRKINRVKG